MGTRKKLRYEELRDTLKAAYENSGKLTPMPSERELSEAYEVSRPTVRKALELLEEEQNIIRIQGKGTFYNGAPSNKPQKESAGVSFPDGPIGQSSPFYHQVSLSGDYTSSKVLTQKIEKADDEVADALKIPVGSSVFHLERLRYVEDQLMSLVDDYLPYELFPDIIQVDFNEATLFKTLIKFDLVPYVGHKIVSTIKAGGYVAANLGVEKGEPINQTQTVTIDKEGQIIIYNKSQSIAYKTVFEVYVFSEQENWPRLQLKDKIKWPNEADNE